MYRYVLLIMSDLNTYYSKLSVQILMNVTVIALTVEMGRVLMYRALTLVSALLATSSTLTSNSVLVNSWIVIISMISVMTTKAYMCTLYLPIV